MSFVKRSSARAREMQEATPAEDSELLAAFPAVFEYLTLCEVEGKARATSTMTLCVDEGMFKVFLNDRDGDRYCAVSGATVRLAMDALELQLTEDSADWRAARPRKGK